VLERCHRADCERSGAVTAATAHALDPDIRDKLAGALDEVRQELTGYIAELAELKLAVRFLPRP
jgi:hypothetical protein